MTVSFRMGEGGAAQGVRVRRDGTEAELPAGMTIDALAKRRSLLEQLDHERRRLDQPGMQVFDKQRQLAFSLVSSAKVRRALDLGKEPDRLRQAYGMTLFGQGWDQHRFRFTAGGELQPDWNQECASSH